MARRGFFAELQHQAKLAAREQERQARAAERAYRAAVREEERARKAEARAQAQLQRAAQAERKRLEKERREAHVAAMEAEVERRNLELQGLYDEIDSLLAATLEVDDYVDLDTLRATAKHPPFDRRDLEVPLPAPEAIPDPPEPVFCPPAPPTGIRGIFGKGKHAKAVAEAEADHALAVEEWERAKSQLPELRSKAEEKHRQEEAARVAALDAERARYAVECEGREAEATARNRELDEFIANLGYGTADAVQEYVSMVLSNSVYPPAFPVSHRFFFNVSNAELQLRVLVPRPGAIPTVKCYKYTKSSDEISETSLSQKACRDRYAGAVNAVAIRSLHEVFESDRRGLIKTISLEVGTETTDPATGRETYVPFVATGAERESFLGFELSGVVPKATLRHLGATVSKNPYDLVAIDASGVRVA